MRTRLKKGSRYAKKFYLLFLLTLLTQELLRYNSAENGVTENDLFQGITSILDTVSAAAATQTDLVLKLYELALKAMQAAGNEVCIPCTDIIKY